jgi:hypothetical protein
MKAADPMLADGARIACGDFGIHPMTLNRHAGLGHYRFSRLNLLLLQPSFPAAKSGDYPLGTALA